MTQGYLRYLCQNCGKEFELPESEALRCPSCFWTTSVTPADSFPRPQSVKSDAPLGKKKKIKIPIAPKFIAPLLAIIFISALTATNWDSIRTLISRVFRTGELQELKPVTIKPTQQPALLTADQALTLLQGDEKNILFSRKPFPDARVLSDEELDILTRRVDFSITGNETPKLVFWTKKQFEDYLTTQQSKRGVYFPRSYEKQLIQLFDQHQPQAASALASGDAVGARDALINALLFPIYKSDLRYHRSVALVMMQLYINDTLAKIMTLNTNVLTAQFQARLAALQAEYDGFFKLVDQQNWKAALDQAKSLEESLKQLDSESKQVNISYPATMSQIDRDIQAGLKRQDEALEPVSVRVNSIAADLRIKEKLLEQNQTEALLSMRQHYEKAMDFVSSSKWNEAMKEFSQVTYPPEIESDARQKQAILDKILKATGTESAAGG